MTAECARCRGPDPMALSGLCAECSKKRADAKDTARLFSRSPVRNRRRTVRRTIPADMTVRTPDQHDRQRCSLCGDLVLDGFEAGHADAHFKNRDAGRPVFTPVAGVTVDHDPAARSGGGIQYGPTTESPKEN